MDIRKNYELLISEKRTADSLKINYLNDVDINVCNYVNSQLPFMEVELFNPGKVVSLEDFIQLSLNEVKIFGDDVYSTACSLISQIPINKCYEDIFRFECRVAYYACFDSNIIVPNSGIITNYFIPKYLYECSVYYFAHEHIHALKETNYEEYKNVFMLGETIPMFFELLIFNPNDILRRELIRRRIFDLLGNKDNFILADELVKSSYSFNLNKEDDVYQQRSIHEYVRSKVGCYLNSFYYALILYSMYKEMPVKILALVSRVLKHEITTLDLLMQLGIYGDIKGDVFERELGYVRKLLR